MTAAGDQLAFAELEPDARSPVFTTTAEQRAAIGARGRDAFLEAGAGTGKTTVLVDRYCAAVADDGVEVETILAFTFTERAAAEMRARIREVLDQRSQGAADPDRSDELRQAARATERAWVLTIHAFCRRLLATHPVAAGLDPRFRVLDAAEAGRLRDRAADAALDSLLAEGDERVAAAAAAYQPWRLLAMTTQAHERLRSQGMADPRLPPVPDPVHSARPEQEARELTDEELEAARSARTALELMIERMHGGYRELKRERSALDFQDLELEALELLRASPRIADRWRERFTHLMVDEFQDTNRVQLELVEALRGQQTRVLMVGDENQSIYRFRNADLEVFRAERRAARDSPGRDVLPLQGNFRSLPAVLAAVNQVGRTLLDGFAELTAGRRPDRGPGTTELLLTLDQGRGADARKWDREEIDLDPAPSASAPRIVAEARFLAQRLRALVDDGDAERGDIVVLLRAFTHVDTYEEALDRAGLRPFVVGGRGYWTQQQVEDVIRLLGAIANPLDDEYLLGSLASFAAGVAPDALWLLRRAAQPDRSHPRPIWPVLEWRFGDGPEPAGHEGRWLDRVAPEDVARLERFCRVLAGLRAGAALLTLEELIERTISGFGYDLGLIARPGGDGRMANVRKLMRLAREYERNEGRDLAGFVALAAQSTKRDEREGMAALQAEEHDGVRVMTVHAAKGLQFPVVAVPDLSRKLNAGHRSADVLIGAAAGGGRRFGMRLAFASAGSVPLWELVELGDAESEAEAEEGCRLVYVAASRAEDRLILSGVYQPSDLNVDEERKPGDTPLRRLLPALVERGWTGGEGEVALAGAVPVGGGDPLPEGRLEIRISEPGPERARELSRRRAAPPEAEGPAIGEPAPALLDPGGSGVPVGHLSYSAVALYERCGYRFYVERVLGAGASLAAAGPAAEEDGAGEAERSEELHEPGLVRSEALAVGNAVHAALEWSARRGWERPSEPLLVGLLRRQGVEDRAAAARAGALVDGWLGSELLARFAAHPVRPELAFLLELGGTVIRGQLDLLVAATDASAGPPTVIDYKTDALDGRPASALAERYRAQREIYALAAAGEAAGVRVGHVFLEAPADPQVESFGPAELDAARARLERLIGEMRAGEFEVTAEPSPAVCFGCPAASRLCPRPAWRPPS